MTNRQDGQEKYERQTFTFEERLILGEAARRMDFARFHEIVMAATIRSLSIPAFLLDPSSCNYASSRLEIATYRK